MPHDQHLFLDGQVEAALGELCEGFGEQWPVFCDLARQSALGYTGFVRDARTRMRRVLRAAYKAREEAACSSRPVPVHSVAWLAWPPVS
jgi:hypothetical protein